MTIISEIAKEFHVDENVLYEILLSFESEDDLKNMIDDLESKGYYLPSNYGFWRDGEMILIDIDFNGRPYGLNNITISIEGLIRMVKKYIDLNNTQSKA